MLLNKLPICNTSTVQQCLLAKINVIFWHRGRSTPHSLIELNIRAKFRQGRGQQKYAKIWWSFLGDPTTCASLVCSCRARGTPGWRGRSGSWPSRPPESSSRRPPPFWDGVIDSRTSNHDRDKKGTSSAVAGYSKGCMLAEFTPSFIRLW